MAAAGRIFGPEWLKYSDPATEFPVIRLTDPAFASGFTAPWQRQFTRRGELLYWSDRAGSRQAFLMNLRTGDSRQITDAAALDRDSLTFTSDDREFLFIDGPSIQMGSVSSDRIRELHRAPDGFSFTALSAASSNSVFVAECAPGKSRIVETGVRGTRTLREFPFGIEILMARPRRNQILYRAAGRIGLLDVAAPKTSHEFRLAPGATGEAIWIPSGRTLAYLHNPDNPRELVTLRENDPDTNTDRLIAKTSQYASVAPNADASVFVGASRSRASSYVLLLVRAVRRELALCEHHASDPSMVRPRFSPDSQSVFFASDRDGKPALYRVHVEKFVEETSDER